MRCDNSSGGALVIAADVAALCPTAIESLPLDYNIFVVISPHSGSRVCACARVRFQLNLPRYHKCILVCDKIITSLNDKDPQGPIRLTCERIIKIRYELAVAKSVCNNRHYYIYYCELCAAVCSMWWILPWERRRG